jgi:hypothetical protein
MRGTLSSIGRIRGNRAACGIEHLAKTASLSLAWGKTLLAMLTACFDAGGSEHDQKCLVVAGFISSADDWIRFDSEWRDRLSRDGIAYFHMVEFAHCYGQFDGWKKQEHRRRKLLADLMGIIKSHAYRKFGCAVVNETLVANLSEDLRAEFYINAYALAGRASVAHVSEWARAEQIPRPALEYIFEDGDLGKGKLMQRMKEDGYPAPGFKGKKDRTDPNGIVIAAFTPLQASDFLAYEMFLGVKRLDDPVSNPRWAIEEFHRIPGEPGIFTVDNMRDFDKQLTLQKRTYEWWMGIRES